MKTDLNRFCLFYFIWNRRNYFDELTCKPTKNVKQKGDHLTETFSPAKLHDKNRNMTKNLHTPNENKRLSDTKKKTPIHSGRSDMCFSLTVSLKKKISPMSQFAIKHSLQWLTIPRKNHFKVLVLHKLNIYLQGTYAYIHKFNLFTVETILAFLGVFFERKKTYHRKSIALTVMLYPHRNLIKMQK